MAYTKQWLSYSDQLEQLIERGMIVSDRDKALDYLERIGYYRLSGYWCAFRKRDSDKKILDQFKEQATFKDAVELYVFDKKLRLLVMDALERIEIALRVDISHTLGELDTFAYQKVQLLHRKFTSQVDMDGKTKHQKWLDSHEQLIQRSKEEFVEHNRREYGLPLAVWVACEVWDFGTTSRLFSGMREAEQDKIAKQYQIVNGRVFASWLRSLVYLRNVCAHHSRLWNRNVDDRPRLPRPPFALPWLPYFANNNHAQTRCFLLLKITQHLLYTINPSSSWEVRMRQHLNDFPNLSHLGLNIQGMGAPKDWEKIW